MSIPMTTYDRLAAAWVPLFYVAHGPAAPVCYLVSPYLLLIQCAGSRYCLRWANVTGTISESSVNRERM